MWGVEKGEESEVILLRWRWEYQQQQDETGPILRREIAIKLPKRIEEPINKEVQISSKVILQEIHNRNKNRLIIFSNNINNNKLIIIIISNNINSPPTPETKELLKFKIVNDKLIDGVCILDGGVCADEEGCEEGVSWWGYWSQTYTVE